MSFFKFLILVTSNLKIGTSYFLLSQWNFRKKIYVTPELDYIQLLATKLGRTNGSIKYARILESLDDGRVKHGPLAVVP